MRSGTEAATGGTAGESVRFRVVQGDILLDPADILVCPVNCQPGVLGAGLAKRFAEAFPHLKGQHRAFCAEGSLRLGRPTLCLSTQTHDGTTLAQGVRFVCQFPTKGHWRDPSRYEYVSEGLERLGLTLLEFDRDEKRIDIAMPALGCGLGGLNFDVVGPMIRFWSHMLPRRFRVTLYRPHEGGR